MGEKETMGASEAAAARGRLNVSATPGGSEGAGILSAAVSSVSDLAAGGDSDSEARKGPNAVNVKLA